MLDMDGNYRQTQQHLTDARPLRIIITSNSRQVNSQSASSFGMDQQPRLLLRPEDAPCGDRRIKLPERSHRHGQSENNQ